MPYLGGLEIITTQNTLFHSLPVSSVLVRSLKKLMINCSVSWNKSENSISLEADEC